MLIGFRRTLARNWFLLGILVALVGGVLVPGPGIAAGSGSTTRTVLVVLIFFVSGLQLRSESILKGLATVRLHVFIQLYIFAITPAYFLFTAARFGAAFDGAMLVGFFALAVLPTTISSCVIFTQSAEGNVVATMFNAAFSNIAGVFISPLLLSLMLRSSGGAIPGGELVTILRNLSLTMLAPVAAGQIARQLIGLQEWAVRHKSKLALLSNLCILLILYLAFSKTIDPDFERQTGEFALPFVYLAVSHIVLLAAAAGGAKVLRFGREDLVSTLFTAPQKTLAMGVPLLTAFFGADSESLGTSLIPLIFYHSWQLLIAGIVVRFVGRSGRETRHRGRPVGSRR